MVYRIRFPLALVAAALLLAIAVAVTITWGSLRSNVSPVGINPTPPLAQLEARPLQLPILNSLTDCSPGPLSTLGYGSGPIHVINGGSNSFTVWGTYFHSLAYSDTFVRGPVLVRGMDLKTGSRVVFVGPGAAGTTVGTDNVDGAWKQQHVEAVIDTGETTPDLGPWFNLRTRHRFDWLFVSGLPAAWSGAVGWQFDGPGFAESYVMCP